MVDKDMEEFNRLEEQCDGFLEVRQWGMMHVPPHRIHEYKKDQTLKQELSDKRRPG
jgi:hypothetical protein